MSSNRAVLLLAGGAGTRLWPLSTEDRPKQFLPLFEGGSLIQQTWARLRKAVEADRIYIATHERYRSLILEQIPEISAENILLEPVRRNTAPAIAACCFEIEHRHPDSTIAIFPSDHHIGDEPTFIGIVDTAFRFAAGSDMLVTIGIQPTEANTGYGYLELGDPIRPGIRQVKRFVEKPDAQRAMEFFRSGRFAWNGGMFVWRADVFARALERFAPEIAGIAGAIRDQTDQDRKAELYASMPSISIDYALMERSDRVATVPGEFRWSDVGSWKAVARLAGTGRSEGVHRTASSGGFVHAEGSRPVAVVGLDNVAVIDSPDGLLVLDLEDSELLSDLVKSLNR